MDRGMATPRRGRQVKPPFAYYGGKSRLAPWIVSMLPPHRVYVEPFAGSAAVLFAKSPARHEVINDVDGDVVNFLRLLRDRPADLERACALTPYARAEFDAADLAEPGLDDLERARRWWVRSTQGFGQSAAKTGWSISIHQSLNRPRSLARRVGTFAALAERLAGVFIESMDAVDVVTRYGVADAALYVDPPYLGATRTSINGGRRPAGDYVHEFHADEDHRRLAEALKATPAAVLLSGYHSELYDELYADWEAIERGVHVQFRQNGQGGYNARTEVIWSNRPLPGRLRFMAGTTEGITP